ncbi:oligosaccharide flippase family protein [bacterium]|nr:oligosaccharide flippase family protein [bacterium]
MSVFQSIKRLFKNSVIYGIGHILSRFITFLLLPLYTHILPKNEYGVVGIFFTYIGILFIVYTYGLSSAFFRFYLAKDRQEERDRVFSTSFFALIITSLALSGLIMTFASPISKMIFSQGVQQISVSLPFLVRMAAVILFFDSIGLLGFLVLLSEERSVTFAILKLCFVLVNMGCNILFLVIWHWGVEGVFLANAIGSVFSMLSVMPVMWKRLRRIFSMSLFRELLAFGLPYIVVNASVVIMDTIDRPLLERLASIEEAGLFNAGVKLGMFMAIFVTAFRFAWIPFFMGHSRQENAKAAFSKVFTYLMTACFTVFLFFSFFIDIIVRFRFFGHSLIGQEYWSSTVVVPVVFFAYIFYAAYINFLIGVYLKKKTIMLSYITAAGMLGNILLNIVLIPVIGMMGAAWARFGAYMIMASSLYFVSQKYYPIQYEWSRILRLLFLTGILFAAGMKVPQGVRLLLVCGMPVWLWMLRFWTAEEKHKVRQGMHWFAGKLTGGSAARNGGSGQGGRS